MAFKSSPPFNIFELSVRCPMTTVMIAFSMLTEEMISGLQRLGWKKVDVSFHSAFWPFFAHNNIHVLTPFLFWVMITLPCWFPSWFNFFFFSHFRWKMNGFIMLGLGWSLMLQTASSNKNPPCILLLACSSQVLQGRALVERCKIIELMMKYKKTASP